MNVRKAELPSLILERQALVIDAEEMEHRCVVIVPSYRVLGDFPTDVVRCTVRGPRFETRPGHPHGKTVSIVIASWSNFIADGLSERSPAEFCREEHQRVF